MNEIVYNPLSQVTSLKTGAYTNNADIEQYSYDAQTGLLTNQKVIKQNTSQTLLDLSYNYNRGNSKGSLNGKTGQLTNIVNNLDRNKDRVYEFDTLGRLITAKGGVAAGGSGVANWTQNYAFDRYGNRTSVSSSGVTANNQAVPTDGLASLSYQTTTNRINTSGYEYDLVGSQTRGQSPTGAWQRFEYDSAGRLVVVKNDSGTVLETYTYGASRMRLITETPSQNQRKYYAWGGSSVLCEYTEALSSNVLTFAKSYIYAGSRLLSTQIWNGTVETTEFHHPDRLGTKLVTNNAANTFYEQSTLPFGTSLDAEFINTPTTNQKFTSYERSAGTGLDYAVNRSYSSGQGRFTTVDPIGAGAADIVNPQSNNLYAYVENNPIDFIDPSGLQLTIIEQTTCIVDGAWLLETGIVRYNCSTTYYFFHTIDQPIGGQPPEVGGGGAEPPEEDECDKALNQRKSEENAIIDEAFSKGGNFTATDTNKNGTIIKPVVGLSESIKLEAINMRKATLMVLNGGLFNGDLSKLEPAIAGGADIFANKYGNGDRKENIFKGKLDGEKGTGSFYHNKDFLRRYIFEILKNARDAIVAFQNCKNKPKNPTIPA
jgi:RHS repeat-associated protein